MEIDESLKDAKLLVPCKLCIFASYEGNTQTGCEANQLEILKEQGAEIIEAYDTEKEFFIIKDRVCMLRRTPEWLTRHEKECAVNHIDRAIQEIKDALSFELILYIGKGKTKEDLYTTLHSVTQLTDRPRKMVVVLNNREEYKPSQLVQDLGVFPGPIKPWNVEVILHDDYTARAAIDVVANTKVVTPYYIVAEAGKTLQPDIFTIVKSAVVEQMKTVLYVRGDDIHGELVFTEVHKFLHGNNTLPICDKIEAIQNRVTNEEAV